MKGKEYYYNGSKKLKNIHKRQKVPKKLLKSTEEHYIRSGKQRVRHKGTAVQ